MGAREGGVGGGAEVGHRGRRAGKAEGKGGLSGAGMRTGRGGVNWWREEDKEGRGMVDVEW